MMSPSPFPIDGLLGTMYPSPSQVIVRFGGCCCVYLKLYFILNIVFKSVLLFMFICPYVFFSLKFAGLIFFIFLNLFLILKN
jgi:hypothetical protein